MGWEPSKYRVLTGLVDVRAFDDEGVAFVRKVIGKLRSLVDLDAIEDQLRAIYEMNRAFSAELVIVTPKLDVWVATLHGGMFTTRSMREAQDDAQRLLARGDVHYRLAGDGYTLDRLAKVEVMARRRSRYDIPALIDMLGVANQPTPSEQELRRAIYDALSWHQDLATRERLLDALATEPDVIADFLIEVMYRQHGLVDELPAMIDHAWRANDQRLAKRLLRTLVKSDDDRRYLAWARANYPALLRQLGL